MTGKLRTRILLGLLANVFVAIFCVALIAILQARRAMREKTIDDLGGIAVQLYHNVSRVLAKAESDLTVVAASPDILSTAVPVAEKLAELERLKRIYRVYDDISLVDLEGNVVASTDYNFRSAWKYQPAFAAAARGERARSNAYFLPHPLRPVIGLFAPVTDEAGRRAGIVAIQLNLRRADDFAAHTRIGRTGYAMVVDEHGKYLYHPDEQKILTRASKELLASVAMKERGISLMGPGGTEYIGNYFDASSAGAAGLKEARPLLWKTIVVQEASEVYEGFGAIAWQIALFSALLFGAAVIVVGWFSRGITRPMERLAEGARRIGQGTWDHRVEIEGSDEMAEVARSFNAMARQIADNHGYLKNVLETLSTMIIAVDAGGVVLQWSPAAERHTGIKAQDAAGKNLWNMLPELSQFVPDFELLIATKEPREHLRRLVQAGERRFLDVSMFPLDHDGEDGALIAMNDVTEQERKDEQLMRAQKMELVGNLAGGLSHDINNSLGSIVGLASLMRHALSQNRIDPADLQEKTALIEESAKRASDTVLKLLTFSRRQEMSLKRVDVGELVSSVMRICAKTFDKSIVQTAELPSGPAPILADASLVEQAILNLCVNAEHAMTLMRPRQEVRGGTLSVRVEPFVASRRFVDSHPEAREGRYIAVRVSDTGVGMTREVMSRIFEPFFTTKGEGRGTGLGLSMVYNIIKRSGGFLTVESEPGAGSVFTAHFPAAASESGVEGRDDGKGSDELEPGRGSVLVVDDEETMRLAASAVLEECGYETTHARNGAEALELYGRSPEKFHLVLLDVAMPVMSGEQTFGKLCELNPGVRVLVTSGFEEDRRVRDLLRAGAVGFIHKPYNVYQLARAVRAALTAPQ